MNSYELSRNWFDWCFENPSKVKPIHSAIFFFAIEHCNRLGWKKEFGFPSQMTMDAIGIRKYQTYGKALSDLVEWGFVEMIEKSKNQYSANIISINAQPKNGKAQGKALDKALVKHGAKQGKSTGQSIGSIDKQETKEQLNNEQGTIPSFDSFLEYALTKEPNIDQADLKRKYDIWVEDDWNDGYGKPIKSWKKKLLNTLPHLKKVKPLESLTEYEARKLPDKQERIRYCELKGIEQSSYRYGNIVNQNSVAF